MGIAALKTRPETVVPPPAVVSQPFHVQATRKELSDALKRLARVAERKSSLKILGHVAIRVSLDGAWLVATDLNLTAEVALRSLTARSGEGCLTVNAKSLSDIVGKLPGDYVSLAYVARGAFPCLEVTAGTASTTIEGIHGRDFPKVPSTDGLTWATVDARSLSSLIKRTEFSICQDETRFHMNGIKLEHDGTTARAISTDGHRLTLAQLELPASDLAGTAVIIPRKACQEIGKLLGRGKGACELAVKHPHVFVRHAGVTLSIKTIDAPFPPYQQVVPNHRSRQATLKREDLIGALERARLVCSETRGVKLTLWSDSVRLFSDHPELGQSCEELSANNVIRNISGDFAIGFNPDYLLDVLEHVDGSHVTLQFGQELDPVLIRSDEHADSFEPLKSPYLGVVMPMRI